MVTLYEKHKSLTQLPIFETETCYIIDPDTLSDIRRDYLTEVSEDQPIYQVIEEAFNQLQNLQIDKNELKHYLRKPEKGETLKAYQKIKDDLRLRIVEYVRTQTYEPSESHVELLKRDNLTKDTRIVLNKHNPFADVTIATQQYITPDTEGNFQTLSFMTGYTMSKIEKNDEYALVLQPSFKVSKSTNRNTFDTTSNIAFDDTITIKMPERRNDKELIYI